MTTATLPRTSGDEREDTASAAGATARSALDRAELVILAGMARALSKMASGSLTAPMAQRQVRALISVSLGEAMRVIRPLLGGLPPDAQQRIRAAILQAQRSAVTAFRQAAGEMSATLATLFAEAVRSYFGGEAATLPPRNTASLRAQQLAAAQEVMDALAASGITGFTDSAGRDWDVAAYVQAAVTLATSRAHLDAQVRSLTAAGTGLVLVAGPTGDATCPRCRPWAGKVVSLGPVPQESSSITDGSGTMRTYQIAGTLEQAMDEGLLHARCRHSLLPWEDGMDIPVPGSAAAVPDYAAQQEARRRYRDLRMARRRAAAALTPLARRQAQARLAVLA
jgi:Phage minor capsid protein 2